MPMKFFRVNISPVFYLFPLLALTMHARAANIAGYLSKDATNTYIRIDQGNPYRIINSNDDISEYLKGLNSGDLLSGAGEWSPQNPEITIQSIDFVGVRRLIGAWVTPNQQVYKFKDFYTLNIETPVIYAPSRNEITQNKNLHRKKKITSKAYSYSLTPHSADTWFIYITDEITTQVALLELKDKTAQITPLDSGGNDPIPPPLQLIKRTKK